MSLPGVTCICPTFNRPPRLAWLLDEVVQCFVDQDYQGPKELLILNDSTTQTLICDHPQVQIVNAAYRSKTLGDKYNRMVTLATYDLILPWEDDDLSRPHRISQAVQKLGKSDYWRGGYMILDETKTPRLSRGRGYGHSASIYRRSAWEKAGKYPSRSGMQDVEFHHRLVKHCFASATTLSDAETPYIQRRHLTNSHLSVKGGDRYYNSLPFPPALTYHIQYNSEVGNGN